MKDFAKKFYKSEAWQRCRASYLSSVGGLCEDCLAQGIYTPAKVVHHKVWLTKENISDATVSLNFDNLKAVCQDCHAKEHEGHHKKQRFFVDDEGNVVGI